MLAIFTSQFSQHKIYHKTDPLRTGQIHLFRSLKSNIPASLINSAFISSTLVGPEKKKEEIISKNFKKPNLNFKLILTHKNYI